MTNRFVIIFILWAVPFCVSIGQEAISEQPLARRLIDNVYQPLHQEFAVAARQWADDVGDLCERSPSSSAYRMQVRFVDLIKSYAAIELFRMGPLLQNNLQNRLFYWPDERRVVERQLRALLTSIEAQKISVRQLAEKSVAVQGFTALERLLFSTSKMPVENKPQCHLTAIVVENIAQMANELDSAWVSDSAFTRSWLQPDIESAYFRTQEEVVRSVFTQIKVGLDVVLDDKLRTLLSTDKNVVRQAPLRISRRTVAMLSGNLTALKALLFESGILDQTGIESGLRVEFEYIGHVLSELKPIIYSLEPDGILNPPQARVLMHKLAAVVAGVRFTVSNDLSQALGMSAGFNSESGD